MATLTQEQKYRKRLDELIRDRRAWLDDWDYVSRFVRNRVESWISDEDPSRESDKSGNSEVYDGTAIEALQLSCDGTTGQLMPANMPFFRLRAADSKLDANQALRQWLDACQDHLYQAFERSNFFQVISEIALDAWSFGTGTIYMEEDPDSGRVYFSSLHLKEIFPVENRWGQVDTMYRRFWMPNHELMDLWGDELDPDRVKVCEEKPDDKTKILHVVEPGDARRYKSTYILLDSKTKDPQDAILDEGGHDFFPYLVWRYRKNTGETYGRSPAMDSINDIIMVNAESKSLAEAAQKAIDPPLLAHESMRGKIKINPRGITYWDQITPGGGQVSSLYGGALGQYPLGIDELARRQKQIRAHFRSDFFSYLLAEAGANGGRERTATEITAIEAQKSAILGSSVGRYLKEVAEPAVRNVFAIELAARRLPEMPREVQALGGARIEIEYTGPLARKQRQYLRAQGIMEGTQAVFGIAQGVPQVLDAFDWDKIATEAADVSGMPSRMRLDDRTVKAIREARAQQQAAIQQAELEIEAAKVNPALSKAPEPGSPADQGRRQ